jgi:serine/threonine-protein kinase RsbT
MNIFADVENRTRLDQCEIRSEYDIVRARQVIREHAKKLSLGLVDQTRITTAASELFRNMFQYAGGGEMLLELAEARGRKVLIISCVDHGPGIPNLELAMSDGFTSSGGMGLGLPGSKRLVDDFFIESKMNAGTTVKVAKWI